MQILANSWFVLYEWSLLNANVVNVFRIILVVEIPWREKLAIPMFLRVHLNHQCALASLKTAFATFSIHL